MSTTLKSRTGTAIRRLRKEAGISQEKLASLAQIDRAHMGKIERGIVNLSIDYIERITKALKISMKELFEEADKS